MIKGLLVSTEQVGHQQVNSTNHTKSPRPLANMNRPPPTEQHGTNYDLYQTWSVQFIEDAFMDQYNHLVKPEALAFKN